MTTTQRIQAIARSIDALCPFGHSIAIDLRRYAGKDVVISVHGCKSYREATEVCRIFGVGEREKRTYEDLSDNGRTVLLGEIAPGIALHVYSDGLPPSCRLEKTIERVPKKHTIDTGEFVEIERTRVVCGQGEAA